MGFNNVILIDNRALIQQQKMIPKHHFIGLKNPQHQQQSLMCIPACVKTIIDNQFKLSYKIGLRAIIKAMCEKVPNYDKFIPKALDDIKSSLRDLLKGHAIAVKEEMDVSKDELLKLISSGIYPMVYLAIDDYYRYRGVKVKEESDDILAHCVIVVGYDEDKEIFGLWDPLDSHEKKDYRFNDVRRIDYKTFLSCWGKAKSRVIYLFQESEQRKLNIF